MKTEEIVLVGWLLMPWEARRAFLDTCVMLGVLTQEESETTIPHRGMVPEFGRCGETHS